MIRKIPLILATATVLALPATQAAAQEDGEWKKGRIYYRAVCTSCHEAEIGESISPAAYTIQEWKDYIASEAGGAHVSEYTAQAYREAVAPDNKVAKAFAALPDETVFADVRAFVIYGAKDSDTPATCN